MKIGVSLYSESDTFVDSIVSSMQEQAAAYEAETGCPVTLNISEPMALSGNSMIRWSSMWHWAMMQFVSIW